MADKLLPYIGKKKQEALECLQATPLDVSEEEAEIINQFSHDQFT